MTTIKKRSKTKRLGESEKALKTAISTITRLYSEDRFDHSTRDTLLAHMSLVERALQKKPKPVAP